jgi:hypothetical protein
VSEILKLSMIPAYVTCVRGLTNYDWSILYKNCINKLLVMIKEVSKSCHSTVFL